MVCGACSKAAYTILIISLGASASVIILYDFSSPRCRTKRWRVLHTFRCIYHNISWYTAALQNTHTTVQYIKRYTQLTINSGSLAGCLSHSLLVDIISFLARSKWIVISSLCGVCVFLRPRLLLGVYICVCVFLPKRVLFSLRRENYNNNKLKFQRALCTVCCVPVAYGKSL